MQLVNPFFRRGLVIGWDPLKLGNALSCLATLFVLGRRTGLPSLYPYAAHYDGLFPTHPKLAKVNLPRSKDADRLLEPLRDLLQSVPHEHPQIAGSSFEELGEARVSGVIWFSRHEARLIDWREGDAERDVKRFCRRGNALVLKGSYWRQYMDMRELAHHGTALRKHLGPLREDAFESRKSAMADQRASGVFLVGVHLRLRDYAIWMDGRFFFPKDAYRSVVARLHAEFGARPHAFYLFSDEPVEAGLFEGLPVVVDQGAFLDDFAALAHCDLVVGPPSTFSTWAAFLGGARRLVLTRERIDAGETLLEKAVVIPFPTGSYLPGDERGAPI